MDYNFVFRFHIFEKPITHLFVFSFFEKFIICFQYVIDNLSVNTEHVIKICAGTKSLSNPNKTWLGEPSQEKVVFLPEDKCELGMIIY